MSVRHYKKRILQEHEEVFEESRKIAPPSAVPISPNLPQINYQPNNNGGTLEKPLNLSLVKTVDQQEKTDFINNSKEKLPELRLIKDVLSQGVKLVGRVPPQEVQLTKKLKLTPSPPEFYSNNHSRNVNNFKKTTPLFAIPKPIKLQPQHHHHHHYQQQQQQNTSNKRRQNQIPKGKMYFVRESKCFVRYCEDTQKELFLTNLKYGANESDNKAEVIKLPVDCMFYTRDSLTVEEYVVEMTNVEKYAPQDFYLFYKFVTGYQICNHNLPVSFLTFLRIYNTNGLNDLLDRYVNLN